MSIGALNKRTLNRDTLDGSFSDLAPIVSIANKCFGEINAVPVDTVTLDDCIFYSPTGVQVILNVANLVGIIIDSSIAISISQSVEVSSQFESFIPISIAQEVSTSIGIGNIIKISQIVNGPNTFLTKHNWDVDILINDIPIPKENIKGGDVVITKEANQNTLCNFSIITTNPMDFLQFIDGGEIIVNYITTTGVYRLFTGIVDLPKIDLINKYIDVQCSDRREDLIKEKMLPLLSTIGRYALEVQGTITTVKQEVDYRLETTPNDIDFDSYNMPNINSWYPKSVADFTLTDSTVFYQKPSIVWQSRGSVINDIVVTVKYNYTRLYQYQRNFTWTDTGDPSFTSNDGIVWKKDNLASHLTVGMLKSAISSAGWKQQGDITYVDHYPYPDYCVAGQSVIGFLACFNWLNDDVGKTRVKDPATGGYITEYYNIPPSTEDETRIISASWSSSTRFSQNIQEIYTCNVKSTQSIDQFGDLTAFNDYTVTDTYDSSNWDNYNPNTTLPSNIVTVGVNFWSNQNPAIATFNNAILTAIDRAKTKIISTHRDTTVTLQIPIQPNYELRHTLEIDTARLACKGKLNKIIHTLNLAEQNVNTTEVDIKLFRSAGSAAETPTAIPPRPSDSPVFDTSTVNFSSRRDQDPATTAGSDAWNGYIGSINHGFQSNIKTEFRVDVPAIPDELRLLRTLNAIQPGAITGTGVGYVVNNPLNYGIGEKSIALDGGTGTVLAGDVITFAGDINQYTVVTGIELPGTITIADPGLIKPLIDETAMTIIADTRIIYETALTADPLDIIF